jgi:glycosyltransferase involved in cell wall biosynthesis
MVALEGMAAGKPVLASPAGGIPEFLPVPPNRLVRTDLVEWVAALDEWVGLALNGQLKAGINLQEAQRRDWSSVARQYLQVYERATANG